MPNDRLPWERRLGATPVAGGRVEFRCWAPAATDVRVRLGGRDTAMDDAGLGVFEATLEAQPGEDYEFVLDGTAWPDPATRWQPEGLRGPSRVVDPRAFEWTDVGWDPPALEELVVYELHVGTFSEEGTFEGAVRHLGELAELGVNAIEV